MEPLVHKDANRPFRLMKLYKRLHTFQLQQFELECVEREHQQSEEEKTLHEYRNRINEYEKTLTNGKNWEYYKKVVNPFELVYTQKKYDNFPESLCTLKPLSRSYFKMLEIFDLIQFKEVMNQNEFIKSAHVCEGPGGFIEALFDEASKVGTKIQTSIAMTLRSNQTNVPGWKRATAFLQKNKNIKIIYGEDNTGNILRIENQQYFIDYCTSSRYGGKVHLFTADGGFDFSCNYENQEQLIFPLLLASTKIGLEVLRPGGVFVLKLFDFYSKSTLDLIYFLSLHFQEWTLYKPSMSRPCNPEQYFIGKGFLGCSDEVMDVMRVWCTMIDNNQKIDVLLKSDYPKDFKKVIEELRSQSFQSQIEYLERVFFLIDKNDETLVQKFLKKNQKSSLEWCQRFHVPIISNRSPSVEALRTDPPASVQL
jgi:23S rRNA U2552 (ribose-2'-O)-methylase RlmE/FtsJ